MNDISLNDLPLATFAAVMNTKFRLCVAAADVVELELIEARAGRSVAPPPGQPCYENFSLLFAGPLDRPLGQRLYSFEHDQIGRFELFIVPVGYGAGGLHYQAVFNRPARTT